ncbi:MAG: homocysteine S-methyltransferase family protein [Candidatus Latescibacterota bacterium]|nr:homocysteine S-methyltransferase family protein [Candidatus Latescibacterota bacterium]
MIFSDRLQQDEPLVLDGGFGTQLFERGVKLPNSALANQQYPDAVAGVHSDYIDAGVDVIETNTFVASSLHLEMAASDDADATTLAGLAVKAARRAVEERDTDRKVYVAGALGPSPGAIEADAGDTDFGIADSKVRKAHTEVATAMAEGDVDLFLVETQFSAREAAIAVDVARQFGLPIGVSMTYKYTKDRASGDVVYRTDWGHSAADVVEILSSGKHSNGVDLLPYLSLLGLNCGAESRREEHSGMAYAMEGIRESKKALEGVGMDNVRLLAYPNAGLPKYNRETHGTYYAQSPSDMAARVKELHDSGAWMIGGCCGTSPAHIRAFRAALDAAPFGDAG